MNAEVELAPEITAAGKTFNFAAPTNSILLTGATGELHFSSFPLSLKEYEQTPYLLISGFLGAFLLQGLLKKYPQASVLCLVRADTPAKGAERLKANLLNHHIWDDAFESRIVPVLGDLGKPRFGLSEVDFKKLTVVESIIHNGATVGFLNI